MSQDSLGISDIGAFVRMTIERAPSWTMPRELVKNAIEAAQLAEGEKEVRITSRHYRGVPKLVLWNTGPGLSDTELVKITHLASSINKTLDLDANFGVGAKVSSLANNKAGMIYRSCKDGAVSEVILAYDDEEQNYVRVKRDVDGELVNVLDVTDVARSDGLDTTGDWTEVMLLGNSLEQNTVETPLITKGRTPQHYLATALYRRFYRVPEDVSIKMDGDFTRFKRDVRKFETIWDRRNKAFARFESVKSEDGTVTVHFFHDPDHKSSPGMRQSAGGALGSTTTTLAIIHKDEMFSVETGVGWSAVAPAFGIPFGSKELCVHIEIADNLARPSQYRERLITRDTGADISPSDFAHLVRELMPDWVKDVVSAASPERAADYDDLQKELQSLLDEFKLKSEGRKKSKDGSPSENRDAGKPEGQGFSGGSGAAQSGGDKPSRRNVFDVPEGAKRSKSAEIFDRAPEIIPLSTEEEITDKDLLGKAALYVPETGQLFVNCLYEAVDAMASEISVLFPDEDDSETVRELAVEAARRAVMLEVGKAVVFALSKRSVSAWTDEELEQALSKVCLSIAADDYRAGLSEARQYVRQQLRARMAA